MKRILIIGSGGAGKSTFARRLGEKTGLEVIHLDQLYWQPNWVEPDKVEWKKTVENLLKGDSWIIDGNYSGSMEMRFAACDTVVFLDFPRTTCVRRALKRSVLSYGKTRSDMGEECPEKFDLEFIKWIWNYPTRTKPKVEALLKQFRREKTIIRLKTNREVESFLSKIPQIK
ncbi:MAG: DNA topology modulation protein [Pyrinomonadaceae bacterium]